VVDFVLPARLFPEGYIPLPDPALRKNPNEIQYFAIAGVLAAAPRISTVVVDNVANQPSCGSFKVTGRRGKLE
jgi:hypothetical protein